MPEPRVPPPDLLELPDLEKAGDESDVDVGSFDLSLGEEEDEVPENEVLQDSFEVDIQVLTDSGSNEAASDLDIGVGDLLGTLPDSPEARDDDDVPAAGADDLDEHLDAPLGNDETSSDTELGDDGLEALPELVRDEGDEGPEIEGALLSAAPEGALAKGPAYDVEWLLMGSACSALYASSSVVLGAAEEQLMRFGRERRSDALPPAVRVSSLSLLDNGGVVMTTTRGLLEQTPDGTWVPWPAPESSRVGHADLVELAATPGTGVVWARLATGALLRRRGGDWERHETDGVVRSLSVQGFRLTLLVLAPRPTLQVSLDAGSSFRELILPEPAASVALGTAPHVLSSGSLIALCDAERGLCVSADGGESFRWVTGAVNVTAIALGEHAGRPAVFAALHREARDVSELIWVDPTTSAAASIAELSGQPDDDSEEIGRTQALVYENGYIWAAGGYGLARLQSR